MIDNHGKADRRLTFGQRQPSSRSSCDEVENKYMEREEGNSGLKRWNVEYMVVDFGGAEERLKDRGMISGGAINRTTRKKEIKRLKQKLKLEEND